MTIEEIKWWRQYATQANGMHVDIYGAIDTLLAEVERLKDYHGCAFAGPGRGDCEAHTDFKGISIPNQHDGPDDTEDVYGRPNGVCWWCWHTEQIRRLHSKRRTTEQKLAAATEALERIAMHFAEMPLDLRLSIMMQNRGRVDEVYQYIARTALERMKG